MSLAAYACDPARTRGRQHFETPAPTRTELQREAKAAGAPGVYYLAR